MAADGFGSVAAGIGIDELAEPASRLARVIVVGNEKGGAGKSSVSMHLVVALLRMDKTVGVIDLDVRQRTLTRYLENRLRWMQTSGSRLPMPEIIRVDASDERDLDRAEAEERARLLSSVERLKAQCDFIVIDAPGGDTFLSRLAHSVADTLVTPLNDSFVDFDLLGRLDPKTGDVLEPSLYSEIVWEARKQRALSGIQQGVDWVVTRNRLSPTKANNQREVGKRLDDLASRIGFRLARGLGERVIYRELFPAGLTLLDLGGKDAPIKLKTMSHLTARLEIRSLIVMLKLPAFDVGRTGDDPSSVAA